MNFFFVRNTYAKITCRVEIRCDTLVDDRQTLRDEIIVQSCVSVKEN